MSAPRSSPTHLAARARRRADQVVDLIVVLIQCGLCPSPASRAGALQQADVGSSRASMKYLRLAKRILKPIAQQTIGHLPPSASRLSGELARHGGVPIRDVRLRPWASLEDPNLPRSPGKVGALFSHIFLRGTDGLPRPLSDYSPKSGRPIVAVDTDCSWDMAPTRCASASRRC
jgi:hypothetical protein